MAGSPWAEATGGTSQQARQVNPAAVQCPYRPGPGAAGRTSTTGVSRLITRICVKIGSHDRLRGLDIGACGFFNWLAHCCTASGAGGRTLIGRSASWASDEPGRGFRLPCLTNFRIGPGTQCFQGLVRRKLTAISPRIIPFGRSALGQRRKSSLRVYFFCTTAITGRLWL